MFFSNTSGISRTFLRLLPFINHHKPLPTNFHISTLTAFALKD
jgi:hypothetical protein